MCWEKKIKTLRKTITSSGSCSQVPQLRQKDGPVTSKF